MVGLDMADERFSCLGAIHTLKSIGHIVFVLFPKLLRKDLKKVNHDTVEGLITSVENDAIVVCTLRSFALQTLIGGLLVVDMRSRVLVWP